MNSDFSKETILDQMREIAARIRDSEIPAGGRNRIKGLLDEIGDILSNSTNGQRQTDDTIFIWSDGACSGNPGPGGWGTIIQIQGKRFELSGSSPETTNNIMELTGALEGIKRTPRDSKIVLASDSRYLINGMQSWIHGWKRRGWKKADGSPVLNREIWIELNQESGCRNITWEWIKGHAGHGPNDRCDALARQAIKAQTGYL